LIICLAPFVTCSTAVIVRPALCSALDPIIQIQSQNRCDIGRQTLLNVSMVNTDGIGIIKSRSPKSLLPTKCYDAKASLVRFSKQTPCSVLPRHCWWKGLIERSFCFLWGSVAVCLSQAFISKPAKKKKAPTMC